MGRQSSRRRRARAARADGPAPAHVPAPGHRLMVRRIRPLAALVTTTVVIIGVVEVSPLTVPRPILVCSLLVLVACLHVVDRQLIQTTVRATALESLARTDALTKIPNRHAAEGLLAEQLARRTRYGDLVTLAMIDVDAFKQINDRYGHDVGDTVLQALVALLLTQMRSVDILVRWGGDELMVIARPRGGSHHANCGIAAAPTGGVRCRRCRRLAPDDRRRYDARAGRRRDRGVRCGPAPAHPTSTRPRDLIVDHGTSPRPDHPRAHGSCAWTRRR